VNKEAAMKLRTLLTCCTLAASSAALADSAVSPIYGVSLPDGYRKW